MRENKTGLFIISAFLLSTFIYAINLWFSVSGFYLLLATLCVLLLVIFNKKLQTNVKIPDYKALFIFILLIFTSFAFTNNVVDINGELSLAMWVNRFSLFLICLGPLLYLFESPKNRIAKFFVLNKYFVILFLFLVAQITILRIVRVPDIDVYQVLRYGPMQLLSLKNPYVTSASAPGLEDIGFNYHHYAYGPTTIYLFLPFDLIFREPRYLLVVASFLTVFCIYQIARKSGYGKEVAQLLSLIFLANPRFIYFLTFSLTDGLVVSLIALCLLFYVNGKKPFMAVALGFVLGIKIFYLLPYLFFMKLHELRNPRFILIGLSTVIFIHLPFLINNWQAMYQSIVVLNTKPEFQPMLTRSSLTFATLIDRQFNVFPAPNFFIIMTVASVLLFWLILPIANNISRALIMVSFVFMTVIFFGPIANANYYFSGSALLLFAFCLLGKEKSLSK